MRHRPEHSCFTPCLGCAYELGALDAKKNPKETAKYVWMVVGSDNPCDIRRYSFSHAQGVEQLAHRKGKSYKDRATGGLWTLFKLVKVSKKSAKPIHD